MINPPQEQRRQEKEGILKRRTNVCICGFSGEKHLRLTAKFSLSADLQTFIQLLSLLAWFLYAANQTEMEVTDKLQNFNLISREHLYGDTNQTPFFPPVKINQDCKSAENGKKVKEREILR